MKVLVLGASGLLGSNVAVVASNCGNTVFGTYRTTEPDLNVETRRCDLTDSAHTSELIKHWHPDIVVNCAAMTDVDSCERQPDQAQAINAVVPKEVCEICQDIDAKFIHISTDYVFGGRQRRPYVEEDEPSPLQVYGQTKRDGEVAVQETALDSLILRPSFVYGTNQSTGDLQGFPAWVQEELQGGNDVSLFTDQYITPSHAGQVAKTVMSLTDCEESGLFHVACGTCTTPYQFGCLIADRLDLDGEVKEGTRADFDRPAPRPAYTCLDVTDLETTLGRSQPDLDDDIARLSLN